MEKGMIYPENFEKKIGFTEVRRLLKGRCLSTLGTEWVDNQVTFRSKYADVMQALGLVEEFRRFAMLYEDAYEANFFDVRESVLHIRPDRTYMEEINLFNLKRSLHTVDQLTSLFKRQSADDGEEHAPFTHLMALAESVGSFEDVVNRIDEVLNKYGRIKDTASPKLLTVRHSIEQTTRNISHSLRNIIQEAQNAGYIDRDVTPTLRDGRLVIPVTTSAKRKIKGIVHDESATGKTVFIEPTAVVEANNRIRQLESEEKREIIRILQELSDMVRPRIPDIMGAMKFLAHIDYLHAVASIADSWNAIVPNVENRPQIHWLEAVHPLLQKSLMQHGSKMVPLDIKMPEKAKIIIISGPNAGGKSVCLKTVGLLQYMLQCGLPVPVNERSKMGVFSSMFIDIGDEQSLEDDLSTYSSHLLNMKQMMKHTNNHSLLLIDEFGSGTEPQIGGALAEAILHRFVASHTYGIITTHYQNLKRVAENYPTVVNGAMLYDRGEMQPLFRMQVGNPGSSFAIEIARKIGIPEDVIAEATDMVGENYILSDKYLQDIVRDKMYWEKKRKNVHKQEKQLEDALSRYDAEMEKLNNERKTVLVNAREEARQLLSQTNAKIENTIRSIREAQAEKERTREARQELQSFKDEVEQAENREDDAIARKIAKIQRRQERRKNKENKKGDATAQLSATSSNGTQPRDTAGKISVGSTVRIKGQTTVGKVEAILGKQARVLFGMMYTNVPISRLQPAEKPKEDTISKVATFLSKETRDAMYEKKLHFKPEIDLRGMRADEAVNEVAHFLDDAIQLEYPQVRILHGTGTGALRQAIRQYVSSVRGVKCYHDEHVQFGGAGITVVELA